MLGTWITSGRPCLPAGLCLPEVVIEVVLKEVKGLVPAEQNEFAQTYTPTVPTISSLAPHGQPFARKFWDFHRRSTR